MRSIVQERPQRHREPRYPIRLPVTMICRGAVSNGLTRNLSLSGMYVDLEDDCPFGAPVELVGTDLTVSISVPSQQDELVCEAVVRWASYDGGLGLQLTEVSPRYPKVLTQLLAGKRSV